MTRSLPGARLAAAAGCLALVVAAGCSSWRPAASSGGPETSGAAAPVQAGTVTAGSVYVPGSNLQGTLRSVGSSTLSNLMVDWGERFETLHPGVRFSIVGGGSASAMAPLIEGRSDLAPMSRPFSAAERAAFKARHGHEPTQLTVAFDAIAVYVHKNNPLPQLTLAQLDAIYSDQPAGGAALLRSWGELGVGGELAAAPIQVYGPQPQHGLHGVFRSMVMGNRGYRIDMTGEPVSSAIVQAAGSEEAAIAFASQMFVTRRTRQVPIAARAGETAHPPTPQAILGGQYPLSRRLYLYVNRTPGQPLPVVLAEFLRFVCARQGQEMAARDGAVALTEALARAECLAAID